MLLWIVLLTQIFIYKTFKLILVKIKKLDKKGFELSGRTLLYILAAILSVVAAFFIVPVLNNLLK